MSYSSNRNINLQLYTEEELVIIESVVKTAINTAMDTIYKISDAKIIEYQRMVAERDKEISRLEVKLQQTENDLKALLVERGQFDSLSGKDCINISLGISNSSYGRPHGENERIDEQDVKAEFPSHGTRTPPSVPTECEDGLSAASSLQMDLEQPISDSSERTTDSVSPVSQPIIPTVKKEHPAVDAVFIKWEMCEQGLADHQECRQMNGCHGHGSMKKRRLTNAERQKRYRERCRATPEGLRAYKERERLSYMKKRVLISEMSEETKRRKRAAWRAAARRARDRKLIQKNLTELGHLAQVDPSKPWLLPHNTDTPKGPPRRPRGRPRTSSAGRRLHSLMPGASV